MSGLQSTESKYGRLTIIGQAEPRNGRKFVLCECDCGVRKEVVLNGLRSGNTKSCGCLRREVASRPGHHQKHGCSTRGKETKAYRAWHGMKDRCGRPQHPQYRDYGGRGIAVCERWKNFENFLADMGEPPPGMSIDRFPDNNGNYEPGNCRWATDKEQHRNTRGNALIEFQGRVQCVAAWAEELNIPGLRGRLRCGWDIERALTTPVRRKSGCR